MPTEKDACLFPQKAGNGGAKVLGTCAICSVGHCQLHCFSLHPLLHTLFLSQQPHLYGRGHMDFVKGFHVNLSEPHTISQSLQDSSPALHCASE